MDDMFINGDTKEMLLERLEKVLTTLKFRWLRLKGKKCLIFAKDVILLGRRIKDGKILMNKHILQKAMEATPENITTIKTLKRYLEIINYLSIGLPRRTEVLHELNKEASGSKKLADKVNWTAELKAAYVKVAKAINEQMLEFFPVEKLLQTYLVVDSSNMGSGAYLYQLNEGKTQIVRLWSKKRGDFKLNSQWSSCQLELSGILNAVLNFVWEIDYVVHPVTIITDSLSVQKLFVRARQGKSLSQDKRINDMIVKLLAFDIEIVYEKGKSTQIHLADFISRSDYLLTDCSKECAVCKLTEENIVPKKALAENLDLVTEYEEPLVSFKKFEKVYEIRDEEAFKIQMSKLQKRFHVTPKLRKEAVEMVVLRSANKKLKRKLERKDPTVSRITHILGELRTNGTTKFLNDRKLIRAMQLSDKIINKALKSKEKGALPGPKDRKAETLRGSTFLCKSDEIGILRKQKIIVGTRAVEPIIIPDAYAAEVIEIFHRGNCGTITRLTNMMKAEVWFNRMANLIQERVNTCLDCTYMRNKPKIVTAQREYDDKQPEYIGETLFADVITRNAHRAHDESTMKYWVVSDCISSYTRLYSIGNKENNAAKATEILIEALADFNRGGQIPVKIIMDGSSVNQSVKKRDIWKDLNVEIIITERAK
jgi:hypothetical protein